MQTGQRQSPVAGLRVHDAGLVEELVFGTRDVAVIDELVSRLCAAHFGSPVAAVLFRATSVGLFWGSPRPTAAESW